MAAPVEKGVWVPEYPGCKESCYKGIPANTYISECAKQLKQFFEKYKNKPGIIWEVEVHYPCYRKPEYVKIRDVDIINNPSSKEIKIILLGPEDTKKTFIVDYPDKFGKDKNPSNKTRFWVYSEEPERDFNLHACYAKKIKHHNNPSTSPEIAKIAEVKEKVISTALLQSSDLEIEDVQATDLKEYALAEVRLGQLLSRQKNYRKAEKVFRNIIDLDPKNAQSYFDLGESLMRQKKYRDAELAFRKAIALDPKNPLSHNNLGFVLMEQGKSRKAREAFEKTVALDRKNTFALSHLLALS